MRKSIRLKGLFYNKDSITEMIRYRHNLKPSKVYSDFSPNDENELARIVDKHAQKLKQSFLKYQNSTKALSKQENIQLKKSTKIKNIKTKSRKNNNGKFSSTINQISRAIKSLARFAKYHFNQPSANQQTKCTDRRIVKAKSTATKLLASFFNSKSAAYATNAEFNLENIGVNKNMKHAKLNKN